jgi:hypothetical protein
MSRMVSEAKNFNKSGLTASRKTEAQTTKRPDRRHREAAPAHGQSKPDWLDSMDRIHQCCRAVEMLGHLLEGQGDEPVSAEAVREAGGTLVGQVKQLRAALADLGVAR